MNNTLIKQIIKEEYNSILSEKYYIEEGWKENIIAAAITAASLFGGVNKSKASTNNSTANIITKTTDSDTLTIPFGKLFGSGRYLFDKDDITPLKQNLEKIADFISKHPNSSFTINIVSSESQVPNRDLNSIPIKGANGKLEYKRLEKGQLAQKRAQIAKFTLESFVEELKQKGFKGNVNIKDSAVIGNTPYKPGDNSNDSKFTAEQYVNVTVTLEDKTTSVNKEEELPIGKFSKRGEAIYNNNGHIRGVVMYATGNTSDLKKSSGIKNIALEDGYIFFSDSNGFLNGEWAKIESQEFGYKSNVNWDDKKKKDDRLKKLNVNSSVNDFNNIIK